ncbi:MAG: amidohydrolase [Thermoplasmatota archaeon]
MPVSWLFRGGPILTQRTVGEEAEALAVEGDRIAAVGRAGEVSALAGASTRIVELEGRALVPGFVDAHCHFVQWSVGLLRLDCARLADADELLQLVAERVKMTPAGGMVVGHSWDESTWRDKKLPDLAKLDAISGAHPVILLRVDRHGALANTNAMRRAGIDVGKYPTGFVSEPDYVKLERAIDPSIATKTSAVGRGLAKANAAGVTSAGVIVRVDDAPALAALGDKATLRSFLYLEEGAQRVQSAFVEPRGVKVYADGSLGSRTAALSRPYADAPAERGRLVHSQERLVSFAHRAGRGREQPAFHAIGDAAVDLVLTAFEKAEFGRDVRPRIEHMESFDVDDVLRLAAVGGIASMQPNFTALWGQPGAMYEQRLGAERALALNRLRLIVDGGARLAFGSDDLPLDPLFGIRAAVSGPTPAHRLTVDEALFAYTAGSAYACRVEGRVGSLSQGGAADLVVLSTDPRRALDKTRVDMTLFNGQLVHETVKA